MIQNNAKNNGFWVVYDNDGRVSVIANYYTKEFRERWFKNMKKIIKVNKPLSYERVNHALSWAVHKYNL